MDARADPGARGRPLYAVPSGEPAGETRPRQGPTRQLRLAVVVGETAFARVVIARAEALGWQHRVLETAPSVGELAATGPEAVLIDPEACPDDPWEYMTHLAVAVPDAVLLVATGPSKVADRVRGLRLGVDDWITKPAHPEEVIARIQAAIRSRGNASGDEAQPIVAGDLQIRPERFQAYVGGESVALTRREYELLELLARSDGRVLEREEIYRRVWGYAMVRGDRSVDVFVQKLRRKLKSASPEWRYLHTHFGVGYRFGAEPTDESG
jgi:DNA-binding response OmpR family regulator